MAVLVATLLPLLFTSLRGAAGDTWEWTHVNSETGTNDPSCLFAGKVTPCSSLEDVATLLEEGNYSHPLKIFIEDMILQLKQPVKFTGINGLTLLGIWESKEVNSRIECTGVEGGMVISHVQNLVIMNLTVTSCAVKYNGEYIAAVFVKSCRDLLIQRVQIMSNNSTGLIIKDTIGSITIVYSHVRYNGPEKICTGHPGGVYIESRIENMTLTIRNCRFERNNYTTNVSSPLKLSGALVIVFRNESCFNNVTIANCTFRKNLAVWGAGIGILFCDNAHNNFISIASWFEKNQVSKSGGGADIRFMGSSSSLKNIVQFQYCTFKINYAQVGGGVRVVSSQYNKQLNIVKFQNCTFCCNSANFGAAIDISPTFQESANTGSLPALIQFQDTTFKKNYVYAVENHVKYSYGTITIARSKVQFMNKIRFIKNKISAVYVTSGIIEFINDTKVTFESNIAYQGGAINLRGFSFIHVHNNVTLIFRYNNALGTGGAIHYYPVELHEFANALPCFIKYIGPQLPIRNRNVAFIFKKNISHKRMGNSIFAATLLPCFAELIESQGMENYPLQDMFNQIGNFSFDSPPDKAFSTYGVNRASRSPEDFQVIAGKEFTYPIELLDELNNSIRFTMFSVRVIKREKRQEDNCVCDYSYYAAGETLRIRGAPNQNCTLELRTRDYKEFAYFININVIPCPPGYFHNSGKRKKVCECSVHITERSYRGIIGCNNTLMQAYVQPGYWVGYLNEASEDLHTGLCPLGFCKYTFGKYLLPNTSNRTALNDFMCGSRRSGVLCSRCREGLSVYYHSPQFTCGDSNMCKYGIMFYVLSEVVPMFLLFTVVIFFDISFTSGNLNGLIFFVQVVDTLSIQGAGVITLSDKIDKFSMIYKLFYGVFNLDFFSIEPLSFCLWNSAKTIDVLAFRFVTTVIACLLVISLVALVKYWCCEHCISLKKRITTTNSMIHGLNAFLILCYVQGIKVSLQILDSSIIWGAGHNIDQTVSTYSGTPHKEHLFHVILACVFITVFVVPPPLLLLGHPIYLRLLAVCGLSENRYFNLPIIKLKPILDSFQGCFKNHLQFFPGVYFVYRIALIAVYAFGTNLIGFYFINELIVLLILCIHSTLQPYKDKRYNILDGLIFTNLFFITGITHFIYTIDTYIFIKTSAICLWVQLIFIYTPLLWLVFVLLLKILKMCWKQIRPKNTVVSTDSLNMSFRRHVGIPYEHFELQ